MRAADVAAALGLEPHPEGGRFRETFRDPRAAGGRSVATAIYYLLEAGEVSRWHRIDAAEVWHHYAGAPLALTVCENGHDAWSVRLGDALASGERPQAIVPAGAWQAAESLGAWSLVGCTVAPGFEFSAFELAPAEWRPTPRG